MTGPIFDTLIMCTLTAVIILISGVWQTSDSSGVTLTSEAFLSTLGPLGPIILFVCVISFGMSTISHIHTTDQLAQSFCLEKTA